MNYPFNIKENDLEPVEIGYIKEVFKGGFTLEGYAKYIENTLTKNGWVKDEEDDYGANWKKSFINEYSTEVNVRICYKNTHFDGAWGWSIQWLEGYYEYQERPIGVSEFDDMRQALILAIHHLLAKGIPFLPATEVWNKQEFYMISPSDLKRNIDLINAMDIYSYYYEAFKIFQEKNDAEILKLLNDYCQRFKGDTEVRKLLEYAKERNEAKDEKCN